jgi:hypothetical protein
MTLFKTPPAHCEVHYSSLKDRACVQRKFNTCTSYWLHCLKLQLLFYTDPQSLAHSVSTLQAFHIAFEVTETEYLSYWLSYK